MAEQLDLSGETRALRRSPVTRGLEGLCALMLASMVVLLFIQVVGRYGFENPPDWTEELARMVFIYLTFVGGALAIVRNAHLRIESFHSRLSPRAKLRAQLMSSGAARIARRPAAQAPSRSPSSMSVRE